MVKSVSWPTPLTTGQRAGGDRARHHLLVECPQVLEAAAAAPHDEHVAFAAARSRPRDRARDLAGGALALTCAG
jgi:hypothetical protein